MKPVHCFLAVIVVIGLVGLSAGTLVHRRMHDGHADVERDYSQGIATIAAASDEPFGRTIENVPAISAFAEVADTDTIPVEVAPPEQERTRQRHVTLEIRLADANPLPGLTKTALPDGDGFIYLHQEIIATNHQIKSVRVAHDAADNPAVSVTFTRDGERAIAKATEDNIGKRLAILIDGNVIAAPTIREKLSEFAMMTGRFDLADAELLVKSISKPRLVVLDKEDGTLEAKVKELLQKYKDSGNKDTRTKLETELAQVLDKQFSTRLQRDELEIDKLEVKVAQLRAKLEQRRQLKQQIIDSRSLQLIREAQGLGWGSVRSTKRRTGLQMDRPGLPGPGVDATNPFRRTTR